VTSKYKSVRLGSLTQLGDAIDDIGAKTILLVTGNESFRTSGASDAVKKHLAGFGVVHLSGFRSNPKIEEVKRAADRVRLQRIDAIIAVGGGSVIDTAKLINVLTPIRGALREYVTGQKRPENRLAPLIAIPTTAGSGSEATHFAVVYAGSTKYSVAADCVRPDYAIVDATMTFSMPPRLTAVCGFDALCQAIESYWAVGSTDESKKHAKAAIQMILPSFRQVVSAPDPDLRSMMSEAAYRAGRAIDISKTTGPHAMSYPLTATFGTSHGHAVALTLGRFIAANSRVDGVKLNERRGRSYLESTMREIHGMLGCGDGEECSDMWYSLMGEVGLETSLGDLGIDVPSGRRRIVEGVNIERLGNNPVVMSAPALSAIIDEL
jgi:alcohol dehydrogenase class IV